MKMKMGPAQHGFRRFGTRALLSFAFVAFNTSATVVDPKAVDSGFGGSVTQANSDAVGVGQNTNVLTLAGIFVDDVYTTEAAPLEQPLNADSVNTSATPLPAAAWMVLAALFGLVSVARRRQKNES